MGLISQLLGLFLLVAGFALGVWGAPYYMLDWGGVLVVTGTILASCGLIVLLLGTLLLRISSLAAEMSALRSATLSPPGFDPQSAHEALAIDAHAAAPGPADSQFELDIARAQLKPPALAASAQDRPAPDRGAIAVPAVAAAGALAVAAQSIFSAVSPSASDRPAADEDTAGGRVDPSFWAADVPAGVADDAAPAYHGPAHAGPAYDLAAEDRSPAPDFVSDVPTDEAADRPGLSDMDRHSLDRLLAQLDVEAGAPSEAPGRLPGPEQEPGPELQSAAELRMPVPSAEEHEYFARIDRAALSLQSLPSADDIAPIEEAAPSFLEPEPVRPSVPDGTFAALRADLEGRFHQDPPYPAEAVAAAHAAPPGDPVAADAMAASAPSEDHGPDQRQDQGPNWFGDDRDDAPILTDVAAGHGPARSGEPYASDDAVSEEPPAYDPQAPESTFLEPPPAPMASDEGVVAAYTMGDSAYALLANGQIRVTTPEGEHLFGSTEELKLFMARRRGTI